MADIPVNERQTATVSRGLLLRWAGWFCFANTPLLLVVATRYVRTMPWPKDAVAGLFLILACFGHFALVAMTPWPLLALVVLAWPRRKLAWALGVTLAVLLLLLVVVDAVVFTLYRFHLNGMVWSLIVNGGMFEILPISARTWVATGLVAVAGLAAEAGLAWGTWAWVSHTQGYGKYVALGATLALVAANGLHAWADAVQRTSLTKVVRLLPAFKPLTAKRALRKLGVEVAKGAAPLRMHPEATGLHYPLEPLDCRPPAHPLNIMLVVLECWRFDMLEQRVTPKLWQFSQQALRFERHSAAANTTRFGIFSLFYGLPGSYWHAMLAEQRGPVLIHQLNQAGYDFAVFASARLSNPEFDRTVFVEIRDRIPLVTRGETPVDRDREITREMLSFLDTRQSDRSFFGFLFYDATHAYTYPPQPPAPFQPASPAINHLELNAATDPEPIRNRFRNAAHFVDSLAGQILQRLEQRGLLENTVVMITSDHGQEFNDTGGNYWGHNSNFSRYQTEVPLVVHWPGRAPTVVNHLSSHQDVAPTLLREVLGCSTPIHSYSTGRSLFDPTPRVPLLLATWDRFALLSPGRIDVMYDMGYTENFDEDYRELSTPVPARLAAAALEQMSRFYARH